VKSICNEAWGLTWQIMSNLILHCFCKKTAHYTESSSKLYLELNSQIANSRSIALLKIQRLSSSYMHSIDALVRKKMQNVCNNVNKIVIICILDNGNQTGMSKIKNSSATV